MKILLLNSPWINNREEYGVKSGTRWAAIRKKDRSMPYFPFPYFMASAAAVLKQSGFDAHIKDAVAEEMNRRDCLDFVAGLKPDILVIEAFTPSIFEDLSFMKEAKERSSCKAVFCGAHPTALPEEILKEPFMDFVLIGEYEYTLRELVKAISRDKTDYSGINGLAYKHEGLVKINPRRQPIQDLDELPFPEREELPIHKYNEPFSRFYPNARVITSRGCPYRCIYCIEPLMYEGSNYKKRSINLVIEEIKILHDKFGIKEVFFDDAIFTIGRAKEIARGILDSGLDMPWSCWMDWNANFGDLKLLKESGCLGIKFGIESPDSDILHKANKPLEIDKVKELIKNCRSLGLLRHATFMFGLPGDTRETMQNTINTAFSLDLTSCQLAIATPLPGTPFYKLAKENNWLVTGDWRKFEPHYSAVVEYPNCSKEDIVAAITLARQKKVGQVLRNPLIALRYLIKLYHQQGAREFFRQLRGKVKFALRAILQKK